MREGPLTRKAGCARLMSERPVTHAGMRYHVRLLGLCLDVVSAPCQCVVCFDAWRVPLHV
jgi:hypothetical protein